MWNVVSGVSFNNCFMIFPTQQRDVQRIVDASAVDSNVQKVIVFGSSVRCSCNPWSDIDVFYCLKEDIEYPHVRADNPIDAWTNFYVDDSLMCEIENTGVVVYERV